MNDNQTENLGQTLAREMKQPVVLVQNNQFASHQAVIALPPGYTHQIIDSEKLQAQPRRKIASVAVTELESFVAYVKRHGSLTDCTIWAEVDYPRGKLDFTAILNDHGDTEEKQAWRDHRATFSPAFSEEWKIWTAQDGKPLTQIEFALFIEHNLKDIASIEGMPTGTQMLAMATDLEINQESKFKSQARLQSGGVRLTFIDDADAETAKTMDVFNKFALGLQVFRNGDAYQVEARLRYRQREGKLSFWYELIRPDITLEAASKDLITTLRDQTGNPFFYGNPFAR
jgi:uncharacterized protein YfdQ (DUF2303 family)